MAFPVGTVLFKIKLPGISDGGYNCLYVVKPEATQGLSSNH